MSAAPLLEVRGLQKAFGGLHVTRSVSFAMQPGHRVGLIGPNGAGKTTLINLITGALRPEAGAVLLDGREVTALPQAQRVKLGLARTFQITQLAPLLPVARQVELAIHERDGSVNRMWRPHTRFPQVRDEAMAILRTLQLESFSGRSPAELAYGQQRLVEVALAMALRPRVLLLDEPMAGVPSAERAIVLRALDTLPRELAILMIEHDMDLVFNFASRILVLADGAVLADGKPGDIRKHAAVRAAYLGTETR
jgi:ABC-type branched-subunit amino acid transport system ATPase component